ncbi:MAG TPA: CBS domain-containing protein [Nitrososphaeraceae archaeon]|jgi:signal-transduction protein with cAMP-binding, CBS, and nucleotidyltransferase domain|nr:CBS domain-containing protein [Nitrososphaeraceae archaeon]
MKLSEDKNLDAPVTNVMDHNVVILDDSASINEVARTMEENGVTSILVRDSESGAVSGIVTERDIIYRAVAKSLGMYKAKIKKIMTTPLITVDKQTSCIEAIKIMREKSLRRLPVLEQGKIIGVVTLMSLAGNVPERNIDLVELEKPQTSETPILTCPYCESKFSDKSELSKHIDRIHLGSGLLEGDLRKWK